MVIIRVLSGRLKKNGQLSQMTVLRLRMVLFLAKRLRQRRVSYLYAFPQGRNAQELGQRPCDVMSRFIFERDAYCATVAVPGPDYDLLAHSDRKLFVAETAKARRALVFRARDLFRLGRLTEDEEPLGIASELVPPDYVYLEAGSVSSKVVSLPPRKRR